MRMIHAITGLALLAACAPAPATAPEPDFQAIGERILQAEAAEAAGWASRDVDAIMNAYAPDAIVMLSGRDPVPNREALRGLFEQFLTDPAFTLTFHSDPPLVAASGELGVAVGVYELTFTDPATRQTGMARGRHLMTWALQDDGEWRIVRQMTAPTPER
ncbi:MAG: DUF4440 domain-containing protein [Hyphomonadaceae bacterium]